MKKKPVFDFKDFLAFFPVIDLPVNLTEESIFAFQQENTPLPQAVIDQFILPIEDGRYDEFTEFVPCFQLQDTLQFTGIVFWKAQLLQYQYILATFDEKHQFIKSAVIAGTQSDGNEIIQSVAHIDEDWIIHIVEGTQDIASKEYDPENSKSYNMEILATGEIIFSLNDELV
jgi:hypothetical protein